MTKKIIATFRGTGYEVEAGQHHDYSFAKIEKNIAKNDSVQVHAYDGCQTNGGGIFAYGVEVPCNDLYSKLLALPEGEQIDLHILAHSRGCISAFMLVRKINENPLLKNRVNIFLDMRDPVPGNLGVTAALDVTQSNVAVQNHNLSHCDNVKQAHVTIQEKGIMDTGFNVLIPIFSANTKVAVEYIPGLHDIQQSRYWVGESYALGQDKTVDHLTCSEKLFNLGLFKSQQLLKEQGVELLHPSYTVENLVARQIEIYEYFLNLYKNDPAKLQQLVSHQRDLHFGGHFITNKSAANADALNIRHAALMNKDNPTPLLTFKNSRVKANRFDVQHGITIDRALLKLKTLNNVELQTIFMDVMDGQSHKSSSSFYAKPCTLIVNPDKSALENLYRNIMNASTKDVKYAIAKKVLGFNADDDKSLQNYLVKCLIAELTKQLPDVQLEAEKSSTSRFRLPKLSFNPSDIHGDL